MSHGGKRGWQLWLDLYLFANVVGYCGWRLWQAALEGHLGYVEAAFAAQNAVLAAVFLLRQPHRALDENPLHQAVALVAFFSGALFMGPPATDHPLLRALSAGTVALANLLGLVTLLNLGKSFGILVAYRELRTTGLYGVVRHPMYATDLLLRVGYLVSHFTATTAALFLVSSACYVYRAILEERFLSQHTGYAEYRARVRFRFVPGLV